MQKVTGDGHSEQPSGQGDNMIDPRAEPDCAGEYDDVHAEFMEATILRQHAHCTPDTCWRQKYIDSLSQVRSVLEDLKSELEEKPSESTTEQQAMKRQSKVQLIEEVSLY